MAVTANADVPMRGTLRAQRLPLHAELLDLPRVDLVVARGELLTVELERP